MTTFKVPNKASINLTDNSGLTKSPAIARIQAENESLVSRKNAVYSEYRGQKTKIAELRRVKSNIDAMLKQEHKPQRRQEQER